MNFLNDTIVAISTPLVTAALGIIRISGPQSLTMTKQLTQKQQYKPHRATLTWINLSPELKDQAVVTFYPAPRSYTGEDLVEISVHGNPLLMKLVIRKLINRNARMADRGEFTRRAFLNGKIDLSQADAVLAMVNAKSLKGLTHAANSLEGKISSTISRALDYIDQTAAELEVCIVNYDALTDNFLKRFETVKNIIKQLKLWAELTSEDLNTPEVILLGSPNAGKSTIFNKIIGEERVIVSEFPGTTRDVVRELVNFDELTAMLVDGAGITQRQYNVNKIEQKGMQFLTDKLKQAKLIILIFDITTNWQEQYQHFKKIVDSKPCLLVLNKTDLMENLPSSHHDAIMISAESGENFEKFKSSISKKLTELVNISDQQNQAGYLSQRASQLCYLAWESINKADQFLAEQIWDLASEEIKQVRKYLGSIIGRDVSPGDLVKFFDRFCIGK